MAHTAPSNVAQGIPNIISIIVTSYKKLLGKIYLQRKRWGRVWRQFQSILDWDRLIFCRLIETYSYKVPHQKNYMRLYWAWIWPTWRQSFSWRYWEALLQIHLQQQNVRAPKTETASFRSQGNNLSPKSQAYLCNSSCSENSFSFRMCLSFLAKLFTCFKKAYCKKFSVSPR